MTNILLINKIIIHFNIPNLDEISMLGNVTWANIHFRMNEIYKPTLLITFGGQNLLLCGDFLQVLNNNCENKIV